MNAETQPPWIERPVIRLDGGLGFDSRFDGIPAEAVERGRELLQALRQELPVHAMRLAAPIRIRTMNRFHREFVALAKIVGADWREILLANVSYDLALATIGCSTVALPTATGPVLARNMDWWPEDVLARSSYAIRTERGDELQFCNAGWPGAVGVVTGMSGRGFAVALNAVICPESFHSRGYPVLLHVRRVVEDAADFEAALKMLSTQRLAVPALFTLVGTGNEQRVVVERSPTKSALRWGRPDVALIATNDYRLLFQTERHEHVGEIYETTCSRFEFLTRFFERHSADRSVADEQLLYALTDPWVIQGITAQHIILRPRERSVRLFVPRRHMTP